MEAIFPEDALPDKWNAFVEINYAFPDPAKINALVDTYADRAQRAERAAGVTRG